MERKSSSGGLERCGIALGFFEVENTTYQAIPLDWGDYYKGLGKNASVFRAVPNGGNEEDAIVVKVCNFADNELTKMAVTRRDRFSREIRAMQHSLDEGKHNLVVQLKGTGEVEVGQWQEREKRWLRRTHQCFLMERAQLHLGDFLKLETEISLQERLCLCADLISSVRALHDIGVYHRDIKPENILRCEEGWKIGDLGLVIFRDDDSEANTREQVGPPRWMSPEAFNKAHCVLRPSNTYIDRQLDERSDVYQLGKVCWHIIQGDIPNGCLMSKDLVEGGESLYGTFLKPMLRYQRSERPLLSELEERLAPVIRQHAAG